MSAESSGHSANQDSEPAASVRWRRLIASHGEKEESLADADKMNGNDSDSTNTTLVSGDDR